MNTLQTYLSLFFSNEKNRQSPQIARAILAGELYKFCALHNGNQKFLESLIVHLQSEINTETSHWLTDLPESPVSITQGARTSVQRKKISKVQIKGFRGFKRNAKAEEDRGTCFHFTDKTGKLFPKVVLFAPNGGGKTSFCEALEYYLTGEIKEATRRGEKLPGYTKPEGESKVPEINLWFHGNDVAITQPNEAERISFRNLFIEKNRINEFALLGSRDSGTNEKDIVANLIGLDELDDLIQKMVQTKSAYEGKFKELKKNSASNKQSQIQLAISNAESQIELRSSDLASRIETLKQQVDGDSENIKELLRAGFTKRKQLKQKLQEEKSKSPISIQKLENDIEQKIADLEQISLTLREKSESKAKLADQFNFKALYDAIKGLEENIQQSKACPACNRPFNVDSENPIKIAEAGRQKLTNLSALQDEIDSLEKKLTSCIQDVSSFFSTVNTNLTNWASIPELSSDLTAFLVEEPEEGIAVYWSSFYTKYKTELSKYFSLQDKCVLLKESIDTANKQVNAKREQLQRDLSALESAMTEGLKARKNLKDSQTEKGKQEKRLGELGDSLQKETNHNQLIDELICAYGKFREDVVKAKKDLERQMTEGIESDVVAIYNQLNLHEDGTEALEQFVLDIPESKTANYSFKIKLKDSDRTTTPGKILSEGHLRVLGLSILLAVLKKENASFLVFDDVVNAIDTEHRLNFMNFICDDSHFKKLQMILTTHDRLFWEMICGIRKRGQAALKGDASFILKHCPKAGIYFEKYSLGYEQKVDEAIEHYDFRQAMVFARIWFESKVNEYHRARNNEMKGKFDKKEEFRPEMLKISLDSQYRDLPEPIKDLTEFYNLQTKLLNWDAMNSGAHATNELSHNFTISADRGEVHEIKASVKLLELVLDEFRKKSEYVDLDAITADVVNAKAAEFRAALVGGEG